MDETVTLTYVLRLRTRLTLWMTVALLPVVGAGWFTREKVATVYRGEYERALRAADEAADRELAAVGEVTQRTLRSLASPDAAMMGGLLQLLRVSGGSLKPSDLKDLRRRAQATMSALDLGALIITGRDDTVLCAPHHTALEDRGAPHVRRLAAKRPGVAVVLREKVAGRDAMVLGAALTVEDRGAQVTILVAREFAADLVEALHRPGVVEARITDGDGDGDSVLATTEPGWASLTGAPAIEKPLLGPDGAPVARLSVAVPPDALRRALREVTLFAAGLAVCTLALAVLLGLGMGRRITGDLDALADAAQAVARGDLEHKVTVRRRDELGELAQAFNAMTDELRRSKELLVQAERQAAWRDIARAIAHEIKNPLTPIQMSVETTRKAWATGHAAFGEIFEESTRTVLEEVERLKRIVAEFSQFARMPRPALQVVDLAELVAGALALYKGSVKVVSALEGGLPPVMADRDQLTQVILNLLENARDAVASRGSEQSVGRITVRTWTGEGTVVLEVADNGPGFDSAIRDKLFLPYFTTKAAGTGLGLAIVRRIVTDHGGKVSAHGEPGQGARFVVELLPASTSTATSLVSP